jgi:hypothetical protein
MAHRRCPANAVWPPLHRPSPHPGEIIKQIQSLALYLAKISGGWLPQDFPQEQAIPPSPRPQPLDSDAKDEVVELPPPPPPKKVQQPKNQQTPQPLTPRKKPRSPNTQTTPPTQKKPKPSLQGKIVYESLPDVVDLKREYALQTAVRSVGGATVVREDEGVCTQYRSWLPVRKEFVQVTRVDSHECELCLSAWNIKPRNMRCQICGKSTKMGTHPPDSYCAWKCISCDYDICLTCIPVVLRTPPYRTIEKEKT